MIKHPLIKTMAVAVFSAGMLVSAVANAVVTEPGMPSIQNGFPSSMVDWLDNPTKYSWNPVNVRLGTHPDRSKGVIYIFPDALTADAWWDGRTPATPPAGIPDDAVGYIHWKLDNNSGQFPGIMAISDDKKFKSNNCFMASGTEIPIDVDENGLYDDNVFVDKKCSNPRGSSKRFKFVVLKADTPIDLVFNTTNTVFNNVDPIHAADDVTDLIYTNYTEPPDVIADDFFRIYRYIMKFGNATGTDSVNEVRDGTRLVGFKVELGYGVDAAFTPSILDDPGTPLPLNESDGLAYEMRLCIADRYFDEESGQTNPGISDCPAGETEVWLGNELATFSPSMYSLTTDKRTAPIGGYWDKNPAGIFAPQNVAFGDPADKNILDSGFAAYIPNLETDPDIPGDQLYDPFPPTNQIGQITTNYYDVAAAQGAGALIPDNMFGYQMYHGVFADGDTGNISMGIYRDDDGDPATEGKLHAWWDGSSPTCCFRWAIDPDRDGNNAGTTDDPNAWGIVSDADLADIASRPMSETETLTPPRYEFGYMDDLGGLNVDTFVKMTPDYSVAAHPNLTIRFTAQSTADAGLTATDPGVADGPWVANPLPVEEDFFDALPTGGSGNGCSCSHSPDGSVDPLLPGLLLAGLIYLGWRSKKREK